MTITNSVGLMPAVTKRHMIKAIQSLPDDATVDDAVERLIGLKRSEMSPESRPSVRPGFGGAKDLIEISPDFDEPLDDFEAYT